MAKLATLGRSVLRFPNGSMRLVMVTIIGAVLGFFIGISFPSVSITKLHFPASFVSYIEDKNSGLTTQAILNHAWTSARNARGNGTEPTSNSTLKIYVPTNPKGAEGLAPGIVVSESDFHLRRLWGDPSEDLPFKPKYLVTFTVGVEQKENINRAVKKFSDNFAILLFHYDGRVSEWDEFEWSQRAIHISVRKQTKWWYAKRFLHPDIVAAYEYIFIWDEDLGVEHFNAEEYIKLVKKHNLAISQPGLEPNRGLTWQMTKRRGDSEVHKDTEERPGWCSDPHLPPCAAFVEIMAPVFSRDAWRCVWHMIQNKVISFRAATVGERWRPRRGAFCRRQAPSHFPPFPLCATDHPKPLCKLLASGSDPSDTPVYRRPRRIQIVLRRLLSAHHAKHP